MKKDITENQVRTINLIVALYENSPSPKFFWKLAKIVLDTYEA